MIRGKGLAGKPATAEAVLKFETLTGWRGCDFHVGFCIS